MNRRKFLQHKAFAVTIGTLAGASKQVFKALNSNMDSQKDDDFQDWAAISSHFLLSPNHIHLAGMLLASHPAPVRQALEMHRKGLDENPVNYIFKHKTQLEDAVYKAAANYLKTSPEQIALTDALATELAILNQIPAAVDAITSTYQIDSVAQNKGEKFDLQAINHLDEENRWVTTRAFPCPEHGARLVQIGALDKRLSAARGRSSN